MLIVPPLNFAIVEPGIYRSGYPNKRNFNFLQKLQLKSIMYINEDNYSEENLEFIKQEHIQIFHLKIAGNKEPFMEIGLFF